MPGYWN